MIIYICLKMKMWEEITYFSFVLTLIIFFFCLILIFHETKKKLRIVLQMRLDFLFQGSKSFCCMIEYFQTVLTQYATKTNVFFSFYQPKEVNYVIITINRFKYTYYACTLMCNKLCFHSADCRKVHVNSLIYSKVVLKVSFFNVRHQS